MGKYTIDGLRQVRAELAKVVTTADDLDNGECGEFAALAEQLHKIVVELGMAEINLRRPGDGYEPPCYHHGAL